MTSQQFWKMLESTLKSPATHQLVPGIIRRAYDLDLTIPVVMNSKGQVFCEAQGRKFGYCAAGLTFNPKMGNSVKERKLREIISDLKTVKCDGICFTSEDPEFGNHFIGVEWSDLL